MKTLVTCADPKLKKALFSEKTIARLNSLTEVIWAEEGKPYTQEQLMKDIADVDFCITSWGVPRFSKEVLDHAAKLKFLGHAAGTVVYVTDEDIFSRGVTVVNANTPLAQSTAELVVALMLSAVWQLKKNFSVRQYGEHTRYFNGLTGSKIGLVGLGEISRFVIKMLKGFDCEILVSSNHMTEGTAEGLGVQKATLDEVLQSCDIVSLHDTLTEKTKDKIGKREFALMKDGAVFLNTARAPVVSEEALISAAKSGKIYIALDVYHREPLEEDSILFALPNVICTPHIGGFSNLHLFGEAVVNDLERFMNNEPLKGELTLELYKRQSPA